MPNSRTDVVPYLRGLERNGEDNIWRTAQQAREEIERLRTALRDVLQSDVGRQTQHKLADGHGTETDSGRAWLAAALLMESNTKLLNTEQIVNPMKDFECDGCGEVWENEFLCAQCSNEPDLVEVQTPDPFWAGDERVPDFMTLERIVYHAVCGNCCGGHPRLANLQIAEHGIPSNDATRPEN